MIISPRFITLLFILLLFALATTMALFIFQKKLYSRLGARIALLILGSGLVALIMALAFNQLAFNAVGHNRFVLRWTQLLQIALLILGGPVVLGLLAWRFVRQPLRQFNNAITSLEQSNYRVALQPTGIREFDEVFTKFNNLISRLQHEEKLRKDLVSDTSHELNTPLAVMIGQLTAMQEGKHPMTGERIVILKEQAERLAELVQQLDAYTKARMPDTGEPEDIHLRQFCEEITNHLGLELKQKGIHVKLHIAEDHVIHANRGPLQQILTNLMQNTLQYSQATEITIEATAHELLFSDNGRGVPAESLPYLFERFYRVDGSRNRTTGGLGLGLAIVRELADSQGWSITATTGHPGLTFVIKL